MMRLAFAALLLVSCNKATPHPIFEVVVSDDGHWSVLHDKARGVTCWHNHRNGGGFACLPDSVLRGAALSTSLGLGVGR